MGQNRFVLEFLERSLSLDLYHNPDLFGAIIIGLTTMLRGFLVTKKKKLKKWLLQNARNLAKLLHQLSPSLFQELDRPYKLLLKDLRGTTQNHFKCKTHKTRSSNFTSVVTEIV